MKAAGLSGATSICNNAAIKLNWGATYNLFFGFKKLKEDSSNNTIQPFSINEQRSITENVKDHWKPYFQIAFFSGVRQGEQIALKRKDVEDCKYPLSSNDTNQTQLRDNCIQLRREPTMDSQGNESP